MTPIWVVVAIVVVLVGVLAVAEVVLEVVVLLVDAYLGCRGSSRGSPFGRRNCGALSMTHLQAPSDRSNEIKTRLSHNQTLHQLSS